MTHRYRLFQRKSGIYFIEDRFSKRQESLRTKDKAEALRLFLAKNEAHQQPALNLQIARAYLMASDPAFTARTWQHVMEEAGKTKTGATLERWLRAIKEPPFDLIRNQKLIDTQAEQLLHVLQRGTVSTNVFLRRVHNFAVDMHWLPCAIIPKKQWPVIRHQEKRAITWEEHQKITRREKNPERKAFYEFCWHLGGSQGDVASIHAEHINWTDRTIAYRRKKTRTPAIVHFGDAVAAILQGLPKEGPLFPYLIRVRASDRATEFKQRCATVAVTGVTLHSYRYAWAERACQAGMSERHAMHMLGHASKAVHRSYSKKAQVRVPNLEELEKKIIPLRQAV